MYTSKLITCPTLTITLFVVLQMIFTVFGADPLLYSCSNNDNYTAQSSYETSLNRLMGYFYFQAHSTGFAIGSLGVEQERPYGLTLCRGDISPLACKTCLLDASNDVRKFCPYNKRVLIAYDFCLLKYSNQDFFGQIDSEAKLFMWNTQNASDAASFNQESRELLSQVAMNASLTRMMYASGETRFKGQYNALNSTKIYGMAQCTRDLSSGDCKKCLDSAIGQLPTCCDGKVGGRVVGGSCSIRYETYTFVSE